MSSDAIERARIERSRAFPCVRDSPKRSAVDFARTRTDLDERADFFERDAGCRELGVTIGTDWAEMRIGEIAWFRFATAAKRAAFRFRVHGGIHAD